MNLFWHRSINFGDLLSPYLLSKFAGIPIEKIEYREHDSPDKKYILTGSILSCDHIQNAVIFGAGFAYSNNYFTAKNVLVKGVRGNLTLQKILDQIDLHGNEITVDAIVGEPSLCLPFFYNPQVFRKYNLGIIPHIVDYERALELYGDDVGVKVIDLRMAEDETITDCAQRVCRLIMSCGKTISSSLHGLIVSAAYRVPTDWCEFSDNVLGDDFKFYDFLDSITDIPPILENIDLRTGKVPSKIILENHRGFINRKINVEQLTNWNFL